MQPRLLCEVINILATGEVRLDGVQKACIHSSSLDGYVATLWGAKSSLHNPGS